jgi:F420-0:gamma-glutamyl ligase-like protein
METLKTLGIDLTLCIAGTAGAIITLGKKALENLPVTITSIMAGVGCANYLTPMIMDVLKLDNPKWQTGLAFILGTIGLKTIEIVGQRVEDGLRKKVSPP